MREESSNKRRVAFVTVGCKLNYSESSTLAREFNDAGFEVVASNKVADIYVINSCSVTEHAEKKCRNLIRRAHRLNRDALIAVTGCWAQLSPEEILGIGGVDLVLGSDEKGNLFMRVMEYERAGGGKEEEIRQQLYSCDIAEVDTIFPAYSSDGRTRSFLKVQDGCDYHCTYCTIPLARGKSRNHPISFLVESAEQIAKRGIKEIVLTGVNTADFGRSSGESFIDLLKAICRVDGIERVRVSSMEPNLMGREVIELFAKEPKLLPHFHIPLQSGSDTILAAMKRRYNSTLFAERVELIKELLPHAFIGVDVIVGFPGEEESHFLESYSLLERLEVSYLHLFPYSIRANTAAALFPNQVTPKEKRERMERMGELSEKLHSAFIEKHRGREEYVLFERGRAGGVMYGYSRNYIRVEQNYNRELIGEIVKVTL